LIFASCRNHNGENVAEQTPNILTPDSLFEPTGNVKLDSLLRLAAVAPQDTNLVNLYYSIGYIYQYTDFEKAKEYYLKLEALSELLDWNEGRYMYAKGHGYALIIKVLPDSALVILQNAYEMAKYEKNKKWEIDLLDGIGYAYFVKRWYTTALTCFMEVLSFYENNKDDKRLQEVYSMVSQLYSFIDNSEKSIEYGKKSVVMNSDNPSSLYALGLAYFCAHRYEEAKEYFDKALRICEIENNIRLMGIIYQRLANYFLYVFDLDRAESFARQSLDIKLKFNRADCGTIHIILGKVEQLRGNFDKSEAYIREALEIANEYEPEAFEERKNCYMALAELTIAQHKYNENIKYWEEIELIELALASETSLRAAEEMAAKYETEKKQSEIERQQSVIARQNTQHWLFVGGIAVCIIILFLLWYLLRLRIRRNSALAERNDALAEMNATKDKFFNIISHDLKNPAISQRDALQMLISNAHLWDDNRLTNYYHELLKSAEGEVELIYNLLGWAQLQTGRITYTPSTFNLAHRLRSDISLIRNMAEKKEVTLAVTIPEDADVTGDGNMISTVVRNLLSNAVKFTSSGGQVTLEVSPRHEDKYIITITDTGIGMNNEQLEMLRTPSLQNAHSRKGTAGEQGSGLGLIVCHELLEKHGSKLYIDSEEGKGSRFYFELKVES
jgi:signal transduction histidine kinase